MPSPQTTKKIHFHFLKDGRSLRNRNKLRAFLSKRFKAGQTSLSALNYIFCDDAFLLAINKAYLKRNYHTDTISFLLSDPGQPLIGDIYISTDRVRENAARFGSSFQKELHRVIFHGTLHLCGLKDKTRREALIMREQEDKWLSLYNPERFT